MCIYPLIVFTEILVICCGIVIVLPLSCLCLVVVWILMKFVNNGEYYDFCMYLVFIFSPDEIPKKYGTICVYKFNL